MDMRTGRPNVVDFARFRAARVQRALPFADASPAAAPGSPTSADRTLSARAVAHRQRMLRFLSGGAAPRPAR